VLFPPFETKVAQRLCADLERALDIRRQHRRSQRLRRLDPRRLAAIVVGPDAGNRSWRQSAGPATHEHTVRACPTCLALESSWLDQRQKIAVRLAQSLRLQSLRFKRLSFGVGPTRELST
jgi:hypothetical protein